jgi:predicted alpha/beta hydrolase family esterase
MKTSQSQASSVPLIQQKSFSLNSATDSFYTGFSKFKILVMPGLHGSEHEHWQSFWELKYPEFQRVHQADWESTDLDIWAKRLISSAQGQSRPVIVVAHSFGCLATIRASALVPGLIAGALLVAPADPFRFGVDSLLPNASLGFPTIVVASTNDPFMDSVKAKHWANQWGSQMLTLIGAGHINVESGFRRWPAGLDLLDSVCEQVENL